MAQNEEAEEKKPEVLSLSGINYQCYRAGQSMGIVHALRDAALNVDALNRHYQPLTVSLALDVMQALPTGHPLRVRVEALPRALEQSLEDVAREFRKKAGEHKEASDLVIGQLHSQGVGLPWWRSRVFLAVSGYITAIVLATLLSTGMVFYLLK